MKQVREVPKCKDLAMAEYKWLSETVEFAEQLMREMRRNHSREPTQENATRLNLTGRLVDIAYDGDYFVDLRGAYKGYTLPCPKCEGTDLRLLWNASVRRCNGCQHQQFFLRCYTNYEWVDQIPDEHLGKFPQLAALVEVGDGT